MGRFMSKSPKTRSILALDPALSTGWAWTDGKRLVSGEWDLSANDPKGVKVTMNTWAWRLRTLGNHLWDTIDLMRGIDTVIIERVSYQGKSSANTMKLQRYVGLMLAYVPEAEIIECSPNSWKASIGGGRMTKPQYRKAAMRYWQLPELPGEDEAAALGMLAWAQGRFK